MLKSLAELTSIKGVTLYQSHRRVKLVSLDVYATHNILFYDYLETR